VKLLSQDPGNYVDAPTEGVRRILEKVTGEKIERGQVLPVDKIGACLILIWIMPGTWLTTRRLHPAEHDRRDERAARA
jgi:hypothetical protein